MAGCPRTGSDPVGDALARCPFLARVCAEQGELYARRFAAAPALPANGRRPLFEETASSFDSVARLFHGPAGVVPLARFSASEHEQQNVLGGSHYDSPARRLGSARGLLRVAPAPAAAGEAVLPVASPLAGHPFASIGLSGRYRPAPGSGGRGGGRGRGRGRQRRRPPGSGNPSSNAGNKPKPPAAGPAGGGTPSSGPTAPAAGGGQCPLRGLVAPLGGLLALPGKMKCPPAICAMRAAVARVKAVRALRPHALPVKFAAVSAFTAAVNLPCGAWREHFEKFSPGWFLAVHLTIPVVGMLRKALLMPPYAVAITLAAAIAGQQLGARLERDRRLRHAAFVAYTPELAASYGCCPVLPPLRETPSNPEFAIGGSPASAANWELLGAAGKPAGLALIRAGMSVSSISALNPLSIAVPVS